MQEPKPSKKQSVPIAKTVKPVSSSDESESSDESGSSDDEVSQSL